MAQLHDRPFHELTTTELYGILRLRSEVFVVEQASIYVDPDGRDLEPATRHLWFAAADGSVIATARVLDDGDARRIGRVVTHPDHRGQGLGAQLVQHALATTRGPWVLNAQAHLVHWYEGFGFVVDGKQYDEDGIPHVPMLRRSNVGARGVDSAI